MRPKKLVWSEGLFVTQHHFQSLDRYHEGLVSERMRALTPFDWGVLSVALDERALAVGQVRISRLAAILPDGTPIDVGEGTDDVIQARTVEEVFGPQVRELDVHVALAVESDDRPTVAADGSSTSSRYRREEVLVPDVNTGVGAQPIAWARKNLRLVLGDERQEGVSSVRVARLVRAPSGAVVQSETFVPPALTIGASPVITQGLSRLLAAMTVRQRSVAASRRQRTEAAVEIDGTDTSKFWLLTCLSGAIPRFAHLASQPSLHPERAYLALAELVGQLSAFAVDADPSTIPPFTYTNLESTFPPLFARAFELVESVIQERFVEIPLERLDDRTRAGKLTPALTMGYEFFLAAKVTSPAISEVELRDRLPRLAKVASRGQIEALLNSAVNGAKIMLEYHPPGALPIKPGMVFFRIFRDSDFWKEIATTGTIAVYLPVDPGAVSLSLYAVDGAYAR